MNKAIRPALLTVGLSAAAVLGYVAYRLIAPAPDTDVGPAPAAQAGRELADRLPEFELDNLEGVPTSIASWPGKPLLVNFWATWCAPCLREIPLLKQFQADHESLQVVGVAVDRRDAVRSFADEINFNYPVLVGEAEAMDAAAAFGANVFALPFTVVTDASGAVLGVHSGEIKAPYLDNLRAVLTDLAADRIDRRTARERIAGKM